MDASMWRKRRAEVFSILEEELFGHLPDIPFGCKFIVDHEDLKRFHGGKSNLRVVHMEVTSNGKMVSVPFVCVLPKSNSPVPAFVMPAFTNLFPVDTVPTEEICDGGFGLVSFDYQAASSDDGDFTSKLAGLFYPDGARGEHDGGKIAIWAWASMRIMDYLVTVPEVDHHRVYVVGHSRLGKTALWASAMDERFGGAISIHSGCAGASLARGSAGETVADITGQFPFWFAPSYAQYSKKEASMPFDQHFLLAMTAPRPLYVESASDDLWADPLGEYLGCGAVSTLYRLLGKKGIEVCSEIGDDVVLNDGQVGYARRPGTHFFTRIDWQRAMTFLSKGE